MNIPNLLTFSRIPLMFLIIAALASPWEGMKSLAFILFCIASFTDWLDGYAARKFSMVSHFGKFMDALTDKILFVGVCIALLNLQLLPQPYLFLILLILSREFLVTGLRLVAAGKGLILAAEKMGKWKTSLQIVSVGIILLSQSIQKDWYFIADRVWAIKIYNTGLLLFLLATGMTILSGLNYLVKYRGIFKEETKGTADK